MEYSVKIDAFEGPLDLLLHLINRLEIDIYDIPVSQITDQYMDFIHTMQELHLDVASEYLVMAATLLAIKSKMLLPHQEEEIFDEDTIYEEEEDPREELIRRLVEYRKYKEAAEDLKSREEERSNYFSKAPSDLSEFMNSEGTAKPTLKSDVSLYDMLRAFQKLLKRKQLQKPLQTKIAKQDYSIDLRMDEIRKSIKRLNGRCYFHDLFTDVNKSLLVVTFLAILELIKTKDIIVEQEHNYEDIMIIANQEV